MDEFEPKKKIKFFTKEFYIKYSYVFILALVLILGVSYSYTFFIQNKKITGGSITTAALTVTYTDQSINATNITVPSTDQEGLGKIVKSFTLTNSTNTDGRVKLTLSRASGLNLTDMKYALVVNGAIQEIGDVPSDGVFYESAIMGNEIIDLELRLWPKTDYSGSATTFVGSITPEIKYFGAKASDRTDLANTYVNFNCNGSTCEVWRIVGVQSGRLVLTREADLTNASSRTNSGLYNSNLTFNDDSMITSVSTDDKNVYLAKTVKIISGDGTQANPYTLSNPMEREPDKKVIATITYKNGTDTVGTQYIYHGQTNYISQVVNDPAFTGWTDETNDYNLGDTITFTTDTILTAKIAHTLNNKIMTLCNDSNIAYVQKYNATQNGAAIDTPDGSGNEDVCFYTTTSTNRNSDAEQNSNVIFGDYCWQIVRTTADGGVKLLYNGPKTNDDKCTSDGDTANYSFNPRPNSIGIVGTNGSQSTNVSGNKKYGTSFEIFDDNGTNKFRIKNVQELSWSDSTYQNIIGKYVCGTSSSPTGTDETCEVLYYVGHYQSNTNASTEKYTTGNNAHYSQIGTSSYNAYYDSPALVGYMYNDVYNVTSKSFSSSSNILNRQSMSNTTAYYYGDDVSWDGTNYKLIDTSTGVAPTTTSTWTDIRGSVGGKYTCKSSNSTTGTTCATVYYVVANSSDSYMYSVALQNNETKDKQVTWHYGTSITKSGNTYMLMDGNNESTLAKTFKVSDWYTTYNTDTGLKDIYVCSDFTSTTCTTAYYISSTSNYQEQHQRLNYTYYFASNINYDDNTNTYSYDTNGTIQEIYDWYHQYNTINNTHYMCETYDPTTHECEANKPMYYINYTSQTSMYYAKLTGVSNISEALVNMLSKDTTINNQVVTVNKYNSSIKGVIDSWYKQNIEDNNLTSYLDDNSVYCNDRTITSYGGWSETGSTTSNYYLQFKYYSISSKTNAKLECSNETDRFSVNNNKAKLTYPVGLLTEPEKAMMYQGFARTGQYWWLGSPYAFRNYDAYGRGVDSSGVNYNNIVYSAYGLHPVIVLKPGIELELGGEGTYNNPYVVKTN